MDDKGAGENAMRVAILLVATATRSAAPARLPQELTRAGFDVAVLAPRDALVTASRFVATVAQLPDAATPLQWVHMFASTVERWRPRLVIPCDDTALHLMILFAERPPEGVPVAQRQRLVGLIRESLGEPRYYRTSIDKTLLPAAAESIGVRVPPYAVIADLAAARRFAQTVGYPVVLKRAFGTAGEAVAVASNEAELEPAFRKLLSVVGASLMDAANLLVQAWIPGKGLLHAVAAWKGVAYAGMTREVLMRSPATGPSTVVRCRHAPEALRFSQLITSRFGMSGFFGAEYIEHEQTGDVYLIEINRRVTNGVQMGGFVGVDLCAALAAALAGGVNTNRTELPLGEEHLIAEFPQEWLRDPSSTFLQHARTDVPWDDLGLFRAMLAMRDAV
jgi:predicted ATP-grasp superfamily ATP-dependent carboligase